MSSYTVIGLMSGTSLDGLDIACCEFSEMEGVWKYSIKDARTVKYTVEMKKNLGNASVLNGLDLTKLSKEFGKFSGQHVKLYCEENTIKPDFIASHGHTVFHQPQNGLTLQIGSGAEIAAITNLATICDFRSSDVALGGQGAPLVPIGDQILFGEYDFCLNLGGFANISFENKNSRASFDICPVNIVMNELCKEIGKDFDLNGDIAKTGKIHQELLNKLNSLTYYAMPFPKSLGKEWIEMNIRPLFYNTGLSLQDRLRTFYEHIAIQLRKSTQHVQNKNIFITGGGAHNSFLIERIQQLTNHRLIIPAEKIINFKEALVFAFLGVLRYREETNCLSSVTGATRDSISGAIYL